MNKNYLTIEGTTLTKCAEEATGEIIIEEGITAIAEYAFYECEHITSVSIPSTVSQIGDFVFGGCFALQSIIISPDNPTFDGRDNCNAIIETATNRLLYGCCNSTIPASVVEIGMAAFMGCVELKSVEFPSSITKIGKHAFDYCTSLKSVVLPPSITCIDNYQFCSCRSLESVTIPEGVTTIGTKAFYSCESLTSITLPSSLTHIGNQAFEFCFNLAKPHIPQSVIEVGEDAFKHIYSKRMKKIKKPCVIR